ncbi:MAG: TetR/AcrR family transcriptional regulator [Chloroflexota bacterium]
MARHKEFNQDKTIEKAMDLFRLKGYEATSIQDLVDHLGIGRGSIYDTFGSKHGLYLAALDRYLSEDNQDGVPLTDDTVSTKALITQMMRHQIDDALNKASSGGCLMVNSAMELGLHDQAVATRIKANLATGEEMFTALLSQGQARGEISPTLDPRAIARSLVNAIVGMRVMAKVDPNRQVLDDLVTVALSVLD